MATKAEIKASVEYNRRQDSITIRPSKEHGALIREAAAASGLSLQQFILRAVDAWMGQQPQQ